MATTKKADDAGQAEVQKTADEAAEDGFLGTKVDPRPNSDYSLESGPDAPSALDAHATALEQRAEQLRNSAKGS